MACSQSDDVLTVIDAFTNAFYQLGGRCKADKDAAHGDAAVWYAGYGNGHCRDHHESNSGKIHYFADYRGSGQRGGIPDAAKIEGMPWPLYFPACSNARVDCCFRDFSDPQHLRMELRIMTPEPLDPCLFFCFIMDALAMPKYLIDNQNTQTIRAVAASDLIMQQPGRKREFASKEASREDLRHRFVLAVLEEDKLDYTGERFSKRFQLDQKRLFFLTVTYTAKGICSYSIDVEKADDSHYALSAEAGEQLRLALDPTLTLWEALMLYLEDHGEGSLLSLMDQEKIMYSGTHYVFWGDWDE